MVTRDALIAALRAYVLAQSRMADRYAEGNDAVKQQLWKALHECELPARALLEAYEAEQKAFNAPSQVQEQVLLRIQGGSTQAVERVRTAIGAALTQPGITVLLTNRGPIVVEPSNDRITSVIEIRVDLT